MHLPIYVERIERRQSLTMKFTAAIQCEMLLKLLLFQYIIVLWETVFNSYFLQELENRGNPPTWEPMRLRTMINCIK